MDSINLNLELDKRIYSINISQSMNLRKLLDEYIEKNLQGKRVEYLYIGTDDEYSKDVLKIDNVFYDFFKINNEFDSIAYTLIQDIPFCDVLFVVLDGYPDKDLYNIIIQSTRPDCNVIYLYDSLIVDYSDGEFYKKHSLPDCHIKTYNRRTDTKLAISTLLNKIKKYSFNYINDPDMTSADECSIVHVVPPSDEMLDYDKVILVNYDDVSDYTVNIRKLLARGFAPEPRDKMIAYWDIDTTYLDESGYRHRLHIHRFSELTVLSLIYEADVMKPPVYEFEYIRHDKRYVVRLPVSLGFIDDLNRNLVETDLPISYQGNRLYFSYVLPLYAVTKRYNKLLFVVNDSVLNKDSVYTAISLTKESFKLCYASNVFMS